MNALLRKELSVWLRACLVAGLIGAAGLIALGRFVLDWGPPDRRWDEGGKLWALFSIAAGASLGFWQLALERREGTEAYLHHRATGAGGALLAKVAAGLLCLALLVALEMGLHLLWFVLFAAQQAPFFAPRLPQHLAIASLVVSSYAVGLWASSLPRREAVRVALLLLALVSLFLLSGVLSLRWDGGPEPPQLRFVLVQLGLAVLLVAQAFRLQCAGAEPERPLPTRLALTLLLPAVVLAGLPLAQMPTGLQHELREEVLSGQPHVVLDQQSGEILAARQTPDGFVRLDPGGEPQGEPLAGYDGWGYRPQHRYVTLFDPRSTPLGWAGEAPPPLRRLFAGTPFQLEAPSLPVRALGRGPRAAWLDPLRGEVLALSDGPGGRSQLLRLPRPDGVRFSPDTVPLFAREQGAVLVDRGDATAWQLVDLPGRPALRPAPLPGGERLLDVERVHGRWRVRVGLLEPYGVSDQLVARGEHGLWQWDGEGWTPFEPEPGDVLESELAEAVAFRLVRADGDALLPHVQVLDADTGALLFEHVVAARSTRQRLALLGAQGVTLLRPPLLALAALGRSADTFDATLPAPTDRLLLDPCLAGGNRPWLAAGALGLALLLALSAWKHIGRAPEDRTRRLVWTAAVVLLGWPAHLALLLVEPARVRGPLREPVAGARPAREPLIAGAR